LAAEPLRVAIATCCFAPQEPSRPEDFVLHTDDIDMILFNETNIAPPLVVPDKEAIQKRADDLAQEDRWVKNLIDGLAGVLRDVKH
jgi:hypothetical protein